MDEGDKREITKIHWENENVQIEENYKRMLEKYPVLKEERYVHRREQLYLMVQQECSEGFIEQYFEQETNAASRDIDLIRAVALIAGEEAARMISGREISYQEAVEAVKEHIMSDQMKEFPKLQELIKEKEQAAYRFQVEQEFLMKERKMAGTYQEKLQEKERELSKERETKFMQEKNTLLEQVKILQQELISKEAQIMKLEQDAKQEMVPTTMPVPEGYGFLAFFRWRRTCQRKKEQELAAIEEQERREREETEKEAYIMKILRNKGFQPPQLEVLLRMVQLPVSVAEIEEIADPDVPVRNMELFEQHLQRRCEKGEGRCRK